MYDLTVLGLDPSLSNFGAVKLKLRLDKDLNVKGFSLVEMKLTETSKGKSKNVRVSSDDIRRIRILKKALNELTQGVDLVMAEVPHGAQNARGQVSQAVCTTLLGCIDLPLIELTADDIKRVVKDKGRVSKQEVIEWAVNKLPNAPWLRDGKGKILKKNEHLADALAAVVAGVRSDAFKNTTMFKQS